MEEEKQLFNKISDYYSGEENTETLKEELENAPGTKELFHWIDLLWNNLAPKSADSGRRIQQRARDKLKFVKHATSSFMLRAVKYAAVVLLALSIGGIVWFFSGEDVRMITADTKIGEIKIINLPDGSKAWLNAQSSISYPEHFNKKLREVTIDGEVYFEVEHDKEHPFIVHSTLVNVKVLGTSFMLSNYANEPIIYTYLAKGRVDLELKKSEKVVKLVPGDEVFYDKQTSVVTKGTNSGFVDDAWRFGKISFYNESLYEIARKLERKFGKEIRIQDEEVGNMKYTADFDSENLEQILKFFSKVSGITYRKTKNGYLVIKK
jgi:ferric-dicitrate binding protein FerR (iron transport regulator)